MKAIGELVAFFATGANVTEQDVELADAEVTLSVRGTPGISKAFLAPPWGAWQTAGKMRISSIQFKDNGIGMNFWGVAQDPRPLLPLSSLSLIDLVGQQELRIKMTGSAAGTDLDMGCAPIIYPNPDQQPSFIGPDEVSRRRISDTILAVPNTITTPTSGAWGTPAAINAEGDPFDSKYDYVVVGYLVSDTVLAVAYSGQVTLKYRWGGPGNAAQPELTSAWFLTWSRAMGYEMMPMFSGSDADKLFVNAITDENGVNPVVTSLLIPLSR